MRRIRLPLGRRLYLLVGFLLLLALTVPLRVALGGFDFDDRGLSARAVTGTIWSGRLTEARLRGLALGDLEAGLHLLPLLIGEAHVGLAGPGWQGTAIQSSDGAGVAGLAGRLGPEALPSALPVASLEFVDVSARFRDSVCAAASGELRVEPRVAVPGLATLGQMQGQLRCDGDALLAPLVSGSGRERVEWRLFGDGRYRVSLILPGGDAMATAALTAAGFVATAEGLTLTTEGSL